MIGLKSSRISGDNTATLLAAHMHCDNAQMTTDSAGLKASVNISQEMCMATAFKAGVIMPEPQGPFIF